MIPMLAIVVGVAAIAAKQGGVQWWGITNLLLYMI